MLHNRMHISELLSIQISRGTQGVRMTEVTKLADYNQSNLQSYMIVVYNGFCVTPITQPPGDPSYFSSINN